MGNQMPNRCMVPCNPVCCAMCFHQDTGREADGEHKTGSIFANAASVLSMAAEEISLDDHLEKELANEVELWRMETSSTGMHGNDAYRTVFAPMDRLEKLGGSSALDSSSILSSPGGRLESIEDIDDMAEYGEGRGRASGDFYGNGRRKLVPVGTGLREGTGLSTESSGGMRGQSTSSPLTQSQSREETATTWREVTTLHQEASGRLPHEGNSWQREATALQQEGTSWQREVTALQQEAVGPLPSTIEDKEPSTEIRDRVISLGARPLPGTTTSTTHLGPTIASFSSTSGPPSSSPTGPSSSVMQQSQGLAPLQHGQTDVPEQDQAVAPLHHSQPDVPEHDEALPQELSSPSSSEEDSFPGFIEDPLEREIQDQVLQVREQTQYSQGSWLTGGPDPHQQYDVSGYFKDPEDNMPVKTLAMDPIVHHGQRGLGVMPTKIAQGVRADRDAF